MDNTNTQQQIDNLEQRVAKLEKTIAAFEQNPPAKPQSKKLSIKEFLLDKNPSDDVKRTLAIAYFYEKNNGFTSVNTTNLLDAYEKAKEKKPVNINDKVNMNIGNGHMAEASEKKGNKKAWYVTSSGEKFVENSFTNPK